MCVVFDENRLQCFAAKYRSVGFGINFKKQPCAILFQKEGISSFNKEVCLEPCAIFT